MNGFSRASVVSLCLALCLACAAPCFGGETVYQYSTLDALAAGLYDGDLSVARLREHGDFGLGTLNGLDGELVILDGTAYHVRAGGEAEQAPDDAKVPFAQIAFFKEDSILRLDHVDSMAALNGQLVEALPGPNQFYAIRIQGRFDDVKARAVDRQNRPYPTLGKALEHEVVVKFRGEGTLVGFYCPAWGRGVWPGGFHWHFLTGDRHGGGHVLDCAFHDLEARVDVLRSLELALPGTPEFQYLDQGGAAGSAEE